MDIASISKRIGVRNNVIFRVIDKRTGIVVSEHQGHNSATNTLLLGVAHYLKGDGVLNQGHDMLSRYLPRYMSLGTMGLINQDSDEFGLPLGIGVNDDQGDDESDEDFEIRRFKEYMKQTPGYGADGYSAAQNNNREFFGLGPEYSDEAIKCELISDTFPRANITYRVILPESQSEIPETIDVVFSAMISTGALAQFRGSNDYIFITEVGLWANRNWSDSVQNGLVAGYRIVPPNSENYDMEEAENRQILRENIIRVGKNQVVQVIWKIQIGIGGSFGADSETYRYLMQIIEELSKSSGSSGSSFAIVSCNGVPSQTSIVGDAFIYYGAPTITFTITNRRGSDSYGQISELYFYDADENRIDLDIVNLESNTTPVSANEAPSKAFDNNINTKWCWNWKSPTTLTIEVSDISQIQRVKYVSYVTGGDSPNRDPVSFTVTGSYRLTNVFSLTVTDAEITTSRKTETQLFEVQ